MESKRMIAVSLAKLQGFRTQRGGMRLHRGLLVSYVLRNAKQAYLGEKYRQLCEYQQYQQQQQQLLQQEDMRQLKQQEQQQQEQQQQWTCGDRSPMTSICSHPALPAAETTALVITEKPVEVSTSDSATTTITTTTLATELPDPSARLCRKRSSSKEGTDDDEGSPPKRPRIQQHQQHHQQQHHQQQQQEQKPSLPREVPTNKKGPHIVRYHPQPLGQLSLNCMAVAAC